MLAHGQGVINVIFIMALAGACGLAFLIFAIWCFASKDKMTACLLLIAALASFWLAYFADRVAAFFGWA